MKILPTTLNHNAAVVSTALLAQDVPDKSMSILKEIQDMSKSEAFESPIQIQAKALDFHMSAPKNDNVQQGAKLLADAAELGTKLPVFDLDRLKEQNAPNHLIKACDSVNQTFQSGTDPESLKAAFNKSADADEHP